MSEPLITCPRCGMTSHHPTDVAEGYCGHCHDWTSAVLMTVGDLLGDPFPLERPSRYLMTPDHRNVFPRPDAWRYLNWEVSADGYRLVIEGGAIVGLAYDEQPYPWGDPRWLTSHLIADHEVRSAAFWPHHTCDEWCVCPRHQTPMIYWPRGDDHACQDVNCVYGHGIRVAIGAELPPRPDQ